MKQQAQEGPIVAKAHAAAQQAAVVVPTQDADAAGRAMPAARWHLALALVAVTAGKEPRGQFPQQLLVPHLKPRSAAEPTLGKQWLPSLSVRHFLGKCRLNTTSQALPVLAGRSEVIYSSDIPSPNGFLWPLTSRSKLFTSSTRHHLASHHGLCPGLLQQPLDWSL